MEPSAPIPGSSTRAPLQPVNRQMHTFPAIKVESKVEPIDEPPKLNAAPVYSGSDDQVKEEHGGYNNVDHISAKHESDEEGISMADGAPPALVERVSLSASIQNVIDEGNPERLELEVKKYKNFLDILKTPLEKGTDNQDAAYFLQNLDLLREQKTDTPTIIGVVGNTGAGKSSVINAMLDEERLVPTNCMRACTAVVTEMSYNHSTDPDAKYRGEIEFIKPSDWEKDLKTSLSELLDDRGEISRECTNPESEAGVAYAKCRAVYPRYIKDMLAKATVAELMSDPEVKRVLGNTRKIQSFRLEPFYKDLQHFVDSKEKSTKKKEKGSKPEKKQTEFWPLIKVVRIYTKSDALSTGAVIVDLPGVHDSNAARAAVAAGYMKECTGLWIVAPINRAVDDKAAKSLLGESFKRQLKYDGKFSRITFICSKTDDISITEASDSLGLEDETSADWAKVDSIDQEIKDRKKSLEEFKANKDICLEVMNEADDEIDIWDKLKVECDEGGTVFAPFKKAQSKKRKRPENSTEPGNNTKKTKNYTSNEDDFDDKHEYHDSDVIPKSDSDSDSEGNASQSDISGDDEQAEALTIEKIDEHLLTLKEDKKRARKERSDLDRKMKEINAEIEALQTERSKIETRMTAVCIEGRNNYSRGAIQLDFAAGIKELDQETAMEEDEENFDPAEDKRDYDKVAQSLRVFCCSSRAYQQMSGRLQRDSTVPGFRALEETEIPQLQKHCKNLTEDVRASNCDRFLTNVQQFLNSLSIWSSNDGTGLNISDAQQQIEHKFLKTRLNQLDRSLDAAVKGCLSEMMDTLTDNIFDNFDRVVQAAVSNAIPTAQRWGNHKEEGGFHWCTYRALVRRNGVFTNGNGPHDLNLQLCTPIIKHLASHWEKAFTKRLPHVLQSFTRKSKNLLKSFHQDIVARSLEQGAGATGLVMLGQQLRTYEAIFANFATQMVELISNLQQEANREFVPVVTERLLQTYETCAAESGGGMYVRMKGHMEGGVASNLDVFADSCNQVKQRLIAMCKDVNDAMSVKAEDVFTNMSRDYTQVISGSAVQGQMMPKQERLVRAEVARVFEELELANQADASSNAETESEETLKSRSHSCNLQ